MFENLFHNPEKEALAAENRAMNFQREQTIVGTGISNANSDTTDLFLQNQKSDLIRWQQECDEELLGLVNQLVGRRMNKDGTITQFAQPLCNNKFIDMVVIPNCQQFMTKNIINTNYSDDEVRMVLKSSLKTIVSNMKNNYNLYDIDFAQYDNIWRIIKNHIQPNAFRAVEGWTKKEDSRVIKRIESLSDNKNNEQKQGFIFNR